MRPRVTQVKPPVVGLTPALRCDLFSCSLLTRSDSNCSTEVLHSARHDDLSWTDDSKSCGSMLHVLRLDFSARPYMVHSIYIVYKRRYINTLPFLSFLNQ